jgi:7,8-dihydropterin-6-yl-methyl-4-(beta-D-ribofuranosyl)aminobenzene 5'-phosphate synthase
VDDKAQSGTPFRHEHGVAFLIETDAGRVLLDTGQSGTVLLHNLAQLGVQPDTIDAVAISHGHDDHTGGLKMLLERLRPRTPLYGNPDLFRERYTEKDGKLKSVGIPLTVQDLETAMSLVLDAEPREIVPGVWTTGQITDRPEIEGGSKGHRMRQGDRLVADEYRDDLALVLETEGQSMLLCGCCHAGLLNTLAHAESNLGRPVDTIAGGLHLPNVSEDDLKHICAALAKRPGLRAVYPNHCTGKDAIAALTWTLGPSVVRPFLAGTMLGL